MISKISENCCGCSACAHSCPIGCISMKGDAEGFIRPFVDRSRCVNCGKCLAVCPEINQEKEHSFFDPSKAHITGFRFNVDPKALRRSASGGAFYALAKKAIDMGGHVFGAAFDETLTVRHIEATDMKNVARMQNSKYVQSDLGNTFSRIRELLDCSDVPIVLFSGTPCQCAGLKRFLGKEVPEKLILVDFICHGVPSPLLFKKYLSWKEAHIGEKITKFDFRTKLIGGWNCNGRIVAFMRFNKKIRPNVVDPYMTNYLSASDYAEACYQCEFATKGKSADITLGDFAGVREEYSDFFSKEGCSIVLTPTLKGEKFLESILKNCETIDVDFARIAPYAPCLTQPVERPAARNTLYKGILEMDDVAFVDKRLLPRSRLKRIAAFFFPYRLKRMLKKLILQR